MEKKTVKLKVKGTKKKIKWSSKKKSIATVTKKGVVKGRKAGKTTIVAKVGKKKYSCKVIVKPYFGISLKTPLPITIDKEWTRLPGKFIPSLVIDSVKLKSEPALSQGGCYDVSISFRSERLYTNTFLDTEVEELCFAVYFNLYDEYGNKIGSDVEREPSGWFGTPDLLVGESRYQKSYSLYDDLKPGSYTLEICPTTD